LVTQIYNGLYAYNRFLTPRHAHELHKRRALRKEAQPVACFKISAACSVVVFSLVHQKKSVQLVVDAVGHGWMNKNKKPREKT
jgi:hypothetical protein